MYKTFSNKGAYTVVALSTILCLAFCLTLLLGYFNFSNLRGYLYFVYLYPWFFVFMLIISVINLTLLNINSVKGLAYRVFNLRLISLFWLIISIAFTIYNLNTSSVTYFILSVFTLVTSLELAETMEFKRSLHLNEDGK